MALRAILSDNNLKQAWFNAVVNQIDKNGPGGIWTHDLSRSAVEGDTAVLENPPPRNTRTQIRIPLIHEVVKIKKEPYVKEEIVIGKKAKN